MTRPASKTAAEDFDFFTNEQGRHTPPLKKLRCRQASLSRAERLQQHWHQRVHLAGTRALGCEAVAKAVLSQAAERVSATRDYLDRHVVRRAAAAHGGGRLMIAIIVGFLRCGENDPFLTEDHGRTSPERLSGPWRYGEAGSSLSTGSSSITEVAPSRALI